MNTAKQLEADIGAFLEKHSMSGARFSKEATGDPSFLFKFLRGRKPTLDTYDKIRRFMHEYEDSVCSTVG
jgi:predicted transcriptional regulator